MLKEMLEKHIEITSEIKDWKEAVGLSAKPLLNNGFIEERYVEAMIQNINKNGSYMVIMPLVAIPHSRPEDGAIKTGMSLLKLHKGVMFPEEKEVKLLIALAASDGDMHLKLIGELCDILMDDEILNRILQAQTKEEIIQCL